MQRVLIILMVVVIALSLGTVFIPVQRAMAADGVYNVPSPSYPTIQEAIDAAYAAGGGTVKVLPGVYQESILLKSGVKVLGAGWAVTTLDGGGIFPCVVAGGEFFDPADSTAVLSGFTITNAASNWEAIILKYSSPVITDCFIVGNQRGGMYSADGSPMVTNCTFYNNNKSTRQGGGMYISGGSPMVTNCNFFANKALFGGGMWADGTTTVTNCNFFLNEAYTAGGGLHSYAGTTTVTNCTFSTNHAEIGGGIFNGLYTTATVNDCKFYANSAERAGGGMYNNRTVKVNNCTFQGNSVIGSSDDRYGGGGMQNAGNVAVTNCSFYSNKSARRGGCMLNYFTCTVTNCNFLANEASTEGGGIWCDGSTTLTNCILWGNSAATGAQIYPSGKYVTYCDVQGGYGGDGNTDDDPMFADPGNLDFHLKADSPCIDTGNNGAVPEWLTTDFEGDLRIVDGHPEDEKPATVDMGVDEFLPTVVNEPPVLTIAPPGPYSVDEGNTIAITVSANDPDIPAQTLTINATGLPSGASFSYDEPMDKYIFSWTPTEDQGPGEYTVTFTASDGAGGSDTETVTITVNEVNKSPSISVPGDPQTVKEGGNASGDPRVYIPLAFTVTATDPDLPVNTLTFSSLNLPLGATLDPVTGEFEWTPDYNAYENAPGDNGTYTVTFTVSDDGSPSLSDGNTVKITVENDPLGATENVSASEGGKVTNEVGTVEVIIPPYALSDDTEINIETHSQYELQDVFGEVIGEQYDFGPSGTTFSEPVTIILYYDPLVVLEPWLLDIYYYNEATGLWEPMYATLDLANHCLYIEVDHFSTYATVQLPTAETINGLIQDLPDDAFDKKPDQQKKALENKLDAIRKQIEAGDYQEAIDKLLNDIKPKMDGEGNDWIINSDAQISLSAMIDTLVEHLQKKL